MLVKSWPEIDFGPSMTSWGRLTNYVSLFKHPWETEIKWDWWENNKQQPCRRGRTEKLDLKITWGTTSIMACNVVFKAIVCSIDVIPATQCRFVSDRCSAESFRHEATRQDGDGGLQSRGLLSQRFCSLETQKGDLEEQRRKWSYAQHNGAAPACAAQWQTDASVSSVCC